MKSWIIGGLVGACLGVGAYLALTKKSAPPVEPPPAPAVAAAPAPPATPVVLVNVVEVADLDPLLDPPAKPVTGVPFDGEAVTIPVSAPAAPERIPPAVD